VVVSSVSTSPDTRLRLRRPAEAELDPTAALQGAEEALAMKAHARCTERLVELWAALPADPEPVELAQPGEGALDDPAQPAEARAVLGGAARDDWLDPARSQLAAVLVEVIASAMRLSARSRGRPILPRTGPTPSMKGRSWVTSLRLPPVRASEMPAGSTSRWCLEPIRPQSTGDGPVWAP
jgi:hypothetical protein